MCLFIYRSLLFLFSISFLTMCEISAETPEAKLEKEQKILADEMRRCPIDDGGACFLDIELRSSNALNRYSITSGVQSSGGSKLTNCITSGGSFEHCNPVKIKAKYSVSVVKYEYDSTRKIGSSPLC